MMKHIWMCAACLLGASLSAETIGNVEFQFPPSNYEWKLLLDENLFGDGDEYSDGQFFLRVFTHREGDALEIFLAEQDTEADYDEETESLEVVQSQIDESVNRFFPNHNFVIRAYEETQTAAFAEWELNDGTQDLMHGYTRVLFTKTDGTLTQTTLCYLTTASRTEYNHAVWKDVLNQIRFIE